MKSKEEGDMPAPTVSAQDTLKTTTTAAAATATTTTDAPASAVAAQYQIALQDHRG
jgi:hypothetical protein